MKLFNLIVISVVCCFLSSCDLIDYKVTVSTGDDRDAGTQGKVSISLHSSKGNSRKIRLDHEGNPVFQRSQIDIFNITTVDIGIVSKIRIELDATELSGNTKWFLDSVFVQDEATEYGQWFNWSQWLITTAKQKIVSVEILSPTADYKVIVETGDQTDAGTLGKVYIAVKGTEGSFLAQLNHERKSEFQPGQTATFHFVSLDIGEVSKIRVDLESKADSPSPNWFLKRVWLADDTRQSYYWFPWNNYLTPTADHQKISIDISSQLPEPHTAYKVIVETGEEKDAGTHGKVYITLLGSKGNSRRIRLNQAGKLAFQRAHTDTFYISTADVGDVSKIRIELDSREESKSANKYWFLKTVSLEDLTQKRQQTRRQRFPWNQWLIQTAYQKTISVEIPANERKQ